MTELLELFQVHLSIIVYVKVSLQKVIAVASV